MADHPVFRLTAVNDHRAFIVYSRVVFPHTNRDTFSLKNVDCWVVAVVLDHLVSALSDLALSVEHKATAEHNYLALVMDSWVALSALNNLLRTELCLLPVYWVAHYLSSSYVLDGLVIHAANHVHRSTHLGDRGTLTWWRYPGLTEWLSSHLGSETFPLLHSLDIALKPAC